MSTSAAPTATATVKAQQPGYNAQSSSQFQASGIAAAGATGYLPNPPSPNLGAPSATFASQNAPHHHHPSNSAGHAQQPPSPSSSVPASPSASASQGIPLGHISPNAAAAGHAQQPPSPSHSNSALSSPSPQAPQQADSTQNTGPGAGSQQPPSPTQGTSTPASTASQAAASHNTASALAAKNKLKKLSHISIATWVGVGMAVGALIVAVYYGEPMLRLAKWTALNDFRESCVNDRELGLASQKCNETLARASMPPPVVKRDSRVLETAADIWKLPLTFAVVMVASVVVAIRFRQYLDPRPKPIVSLGRTQICGYRTGTDLDTILLHEKEKLAEHIATDVHTTGAEGPKVGNLPETDVTGFDCNGYSASALEVDVDQESPYGSVQLEQEQQHQSSESSETDDGESLRFVQETTPPPDNSESDTNTMGSPQDKIEFIDRLSRRWIHFWRGINKVRSRNAEREFRTAAEGIYPSIPGEDRRNKTLETVTSQWSSTTHFTTPNEPS